MTGALEDVLPAVKAEAAGIIRHFRGEPNRALSNSRELRWGRKGSLVLTLIGAHGGRWVDFEVGASGDALDFVRHETGDGFAEALNWAASFVGAAASDPFAAAWRTSIPRAARLSAANDAKKKRKVTEAARILREAVPITGTPAEAYISARLGAPVPTDALATRNLRFHQSPWFGAEWIEGAAGALIAVMRDPKTGEGCGIQRTFLDNHFAKLDRRMLGRAGVVFLYPFENVEAGLGLCEGNETGLAVQARFGWRPVWCAMSASGLASFPVLPGIETLTIFADHDEAGQRAANNCAIRWSDAGVEVQILTPPDIGADFADEPR